MKDILQQVVSDTTDDARKRNVAREYLQARLDAPIHQGA